MLSIKDKIIKERICSAYCDTCEHDDTEECDFCHFKSTGDKCADCNYADYYQKHKWHDLRKDRNDLPKSNGRYIVARTWGLNKISYLIVYYASNLYDADEFSFWNRNGIGGFYDYDSEAGDYELDGVIAWTVIPEIER